MLNKIELRSKFVGKEYGVVGDGGFTLNKKNETVKINGHTPIKKDKTKSIADTDKAKKQEFEQNACDC